MLYMHGIAGDLMSILFVSQTFAGKCRALLIFLIGQKRINEDTKNLL